MKPTKILSLLVCISIAVSILCACDNKDGGDIENTTREQSTEFNLGSETNKPSENLQENTEHAKALDLLQSNQAVFDALNEGMALVATEASETLYGEKCKIYALGSNSDEKFTAEYHYAVSPSGALYQLDALANEYFPTNALAEVYEAAYAEETLANSEPLFAIVTEDALSQYPALEIGATEIEINAISDSDDRFLLIALNDGTDISLNSVTFENDELVTGETVEHIASAKRGYVYKIHATLAETMPMIKITANFGEKSAEFFVTRDGRGENFGMYGY